MKIIFDFNTPGTTVPGVFLTMYRFGPAGTGAGKPRRERAASPGPHICLCGKTFAAGSPARGPAPAGSPARRCSVHPE